MRQPPSLLLLAAALLPACGCSYALHPPRLLAGKHFESGRVAELTPGLSDQRVLGTLGPPFEVAATTSGGAVWRFYERTQDRGCRVVAFGFIPMGDAPIRTMDVRVHLERGLVTRIVVARAK